jgi:hypothetical protein
LVAFACHDSFCTSNGFIVSIEQEKACRTFGMGINDSTLHTCQHRINLAQTTTTTKSVEIVILKDSDGDGILDKDDAHPTVAEIYIVKDDDRNGIVDSFEK